MIIHDFQAKTNLLLTKCVGLITFDSNYQPLVIKIFLCR